MRRGAADKGPALMDDKWLYGSEPENIVATILEGRPNGMPAFGGRVNEAQVVAARGVRALDGGAQCPSDAAPSRNDDNDRTPGRKPHGPAAPRRVDVARKMTALPQLAGNPMQDALNATGVQAAHVENLWWLMFWVCTAVFVAVMVALRRIGGSCASRGAAG